MPQFNIRPNTVPRRRSSTPSTPSPRRSVRRTRPAPWSPRPIQTGPRQGPYVPETPQPPTLPQLPSPSGLGRAGLAPYIPPQIRDIAGGRISVALRAYRFYNEWNEYIKTGPMTRSLVWYNYTKVESCGGGGGPVSRTQSWPSCNPAGFAFNPLTAGNYTPNYNARVYVWGDPTGQKVGNSVFYKPGFSLLPVSGYRRVGHHTIPQPNPVPHPDLRPDIAPHPDVVVAPPVPIPRVLVPYRPQVAPYRNVGYDVGTYAGHTGTGLQPRPTPIARPNVLPGEGPVTRPHEDRPGPRVRERKARVPQWVMTALRASHAVGEADDALDALFDALPKHIQQRVPRTGRTKRGAKIGEGKAYLTPYDKAKALARYWRELDISEAIWNLIKNHVIDEIIGRTNQGADAFSNKRLGGSRFV